MEISQLNPLVLSFILFFVLLGAVITGGLVLAFISHHLSDAIDESRKSGQKS